MQPQVPVEVHENKQKENLLESLLITDGCSGKELFGVFFIIYMFVW